MSKKSGFNETRRLMLAKTDGRCWYCGTKLNLTLTKVSKSYTVDHKIPRAKGGSNDFDNLVPCCKKCNEDKAALSLKEYRKVKSQRLTYRRANDRRVIFYGEQCGLEDNINTTRKWLRELYGTACMFRGMGMLKKKKFRKMIGMEEDVPNNN